MKKAIILCESGWRDIRELSLELERRRISSFVLVKGNPGREVKKFISKHPRIRNIFFPRLLFRVRLPSTILFFRFFADSNVCVWSRSRTYRLIYPYCKLAGIKLIQMIEEGNKSSLDAMKENVSKVADQIEEVIKP